MTKLELITVLRSLRKLHEKGLHDAALEVIDEILEEASNETKKTKPSD